MPENETRRQDSDILCMFNMVQQDFPEPELMSLALGTPPPGGPKDIP